MLNNINSILSVSFIDKNNKKYNSNDILMQYINKDNYFVTFTDINKLGINPHTDYDNTPLGIYCYPIKESYNYYFIKEGGKEFYNTFIDSLPTMFKKKYFTIFTINNINNIIKYNNYNYSNLQQDIIELSKHYNLKEIKISLSKTSSAITNILNIVRTISQYITQDKSNSNYDRIGVKMNYILSNILGYRGIIDEGYGFIHEAEPCQAVFFNIKNIKIIGTYDNSILTKKNYNELKDEV